MLFPGESTRVHVYAGFPSDAFAFASAELDVFADIPAWTAATDGVILGADVLGINPSQPHAPHQGVYADPANPIHVWEGRFEPASWHPRLVRIAAVPTAFEYYPSEQTFSTAQCEAAPGREWIMVNPEPFADGWAAPAEGTTLEPGQGGLDVIVASSTTDRILVGLLIPAVQGARIDPEGDPDSLTIEVGVARGGPLPSEQITMGYTEIDGTYIFEARAERATYLTYKLMRSGRPVATFLDNGESPFSVDRLPDRHSTAARTIQQHAIHGDASRPTPEIVCTLAYDEPATFELADGRRIEADEVRVHCRNNLKQMGLAVLNVYDVRGVESLAIQIEE